jgi:uncharacterized protein YndB with AHSA1/START domain
VSGTAGSTTAGARTAGRTVSVSRVVKAPAATIFAVIDDPARHPEFDGSGTVRAAHSGGGSHLRLGDRFGMDMKLGVPYRMSNTVVEYEADRLLAWAHFGGHRWRYELEPVPGDENGSTTVTETFDWSTAKAPWFIELVGYPRKHVPNMTRTLERLAALVETA